MSVCNDCTLDTPAETENWLPGVDGVFDIRSSTGFTWRGDIASILSNGASGPFLSNNMDPTNWRFLADGWQGVSCHACGYAAAGTVLAYPAAGGNTPAASSGTAGETVYGVSIGAFGNNPIIATSGVAKCTLASATTAANVPLRTASSGQCVEASGSNDPTSPFIGFSTSGATPSGSPVSIRLRIGSP